MTTFEETWKPVKATVAADKKQEKGEHIPYPMTDEMRHMLKDSYKLVHRAYYKVAVLN